MLYTLLFISPSLVAKKFSSVTKYNVRTGCLHLQHPCPLSSGKPSSIVSAVVDVGLVGPTLKSTDTQVGEWVNVIGYVVEKAVDGTKQEIGVRVQALMLWSAGAVNIKEYERAVEGRRATE